MSKVLSFSPFARGGSTVLIALWSESGGGKTRSALELAKGLAGEAGKIIVIDTENGRARHYAPTPPDPRFLYAELPPPFTPQRYVDALDDAAELKPSVVVLDTASHEWSYEGGVIDQFEQEGAFAKGGGPHKMRGPLARHEKFRQRLLFFPCHLVITLQSKPKLKSRKIIDPQTGMEKTEWDDIGYQPIQRWN